jgi:hypothetical protein
LKQLGFVFDRNKRDQSSCIHADQAGCTEDACFIARELLLGDELPPFARKVGQFRKGDVLLLGLNQDGGIAGRLRG